jgi:hypothetical protein
VSDNRQCERKGECNTGKETDKEEGQSGNVKMNMDKKTVIATRTRRYPRNSQPCRRKLTRLECCRKESSK